MSKFSNKIISLAEKIDSFLCRYNIRHVWMYDWAGRELNLPSGYCKQKCEVCGKTKIDKEPFWWYGN